MSDILEYTIIEDIDRKKFTDLALKSYEIDSESLITDVDFGEPLTKIKRWFDYGYFKRIAKTEKIYIGYLLAHEYLDNKQLAVSLDIVWVHPDFRGNGIATSFFKELVNFAHNNEIHVLTGNCHVSRITFFEALGCDINSDFGKNFKPFRKVL